MKRVDGSSVKRRIDVMIFFCISLFCGIASAGETCLAKSIDGVGKCGGRGFAKKTIDRELRGLSMPAAQPPLSLNPDLLATQLFGELAQGRLVAVAGGINEWVLIAKSAREPQFTRRQQPTLVSTFPEKEALFLVRWEEYSPIDAAISDAGTGNEKDRISPRPRLPSVHVIASHSMTTEKWRESNKKVEIGGLMDVPSCLDPEAEKNSNHTRSSRVPVDTVAADDQEYPVLSEEFRWIKISAKQKLLAATVLRSEGYAGGSGSFTAEILLSLEGPKLRPIACYATGRYQMFGGEWNPDGTRQHPESQASWNMKPGRHGEWPDLRLRPTTSKTPDGMLFWNSEKRVYGSR